MTALLRHSVTRLVFVVAVSAVVLLGAGSLMAPWQAEPGAPAGSGAPAPRDAGAAAIQKLQARLHRVPGDWTAWAALGAAYVEQARVSYDPAFYAKAEQAARRSLELEPDNAEALGARAALHAARHDFAPAHADAQAAHERNPFDPDALGVLADALIELGRYEEGFDVIQRMLDVRPGVPSFTRASYSFELRGDLRGARYALDRAAGVAASAQDRAFVALLTGELAWHAGDAASALAHYETGLRATPDGPSLRAARAKALAALGDRPAALREYESVTDDLPQPEFLIAYGELLEAGGDREKAEEQYALVRAQQRLLAAEGVNVDLELALFEADHGSAAAAVAAARAEADKRRSVFAHDALAWALHAAGKDAEALPHADAALALGTRSAALHYHRGMILLGLDRPTDALTALREALALNPHFSSVHAPRAQAAIAELSRGARG